jgi:hypothetical protein
LLGACTAQLSVAEIDRRIDAEAQASGVDAAHDDTHEVSGWAMGGVASPMAAGPVVRVSLR